MKHNLKPMTSEEAKAKSKERKEMVANFCRLDKNKYLRLDLVPERYKYLFYTIYNSFDKSLLKKRINAKCLDCCAFDKNEITDCTLRNCPLWPVRPYQKKDN